MNEASVVLLGREFFQAAIEISAPVLIVAVVVGVMVSVGQVVTSIQDMTLSFVIRLGAVVLVLAVAGPWMLHSMVLFTSDLWREIPAIVGGGR